MGQSDARAHQVDASMLKVRGRAQSSEGLVVVESDAYGTITDLQISAAAMNVEPGRLATLITQCHRKAREEAEVEAARLLGKLTANNRSAGPAAAYDPSYGDVDDPEYHPGRRKSRIAAD